MGTTTGIGSTTEHQEKAHNPATEYVSKCRGAADDAMFRIFKAGYNHALLDMKREAPELTLLYEWKSFFEAMRGRMGGGFETERALLGSIIKGERPRFSPEDP